MSCAASDLRRVLAVAGLWLLGSCSIAMDVPPPFLQLESPGDELKATTPDDARLWVREFADPDEGDASFWSDALGHDLELRGYQPVGDVEDVRDAEGRVGHLRTYTVDVDGREHGYLVAVFVRSTWLGDHFVRVAEFVAPKARFDELAPAVRAALATLEP